MAVVNKQEPYIKCAFCGAGITCEHGKCETCEKCRPCERDAKHGKCLAKNCTAWGKKNQAGNRTISWAKMFAQMKNAESLKAGNLDTQSGCTEIPSGSAPSGAGRSSSGRSSTKIAAVGKHWKRKSNVIVLPDGREICNPVTVIGKAEYSARTYAMWKRQGHICCNCKLGLRWVEATFEHEQGRCAGRRDDRIQIDGKPINGASHASCNIARGSKRTPIWHGEPA